MARVKIRLMGQEKDIAPIVAAFAAAKETVYVSEYYPNRPPSKEGRVYIEVDL